MTTMSVVTETSKVYVHITLMLSDGSVADSTKAAGRAQIIQLGNGSVSDKMEQQLLGMKVGQSKTFALNAIDAYGESLPDLIHHMEPHQFPSDMELQSGLVIAFEQPDGNSLPGLIREVSGGSVTVDFNHPLAGQDITFQVEVLSINTPPIVTVN